MYYTVQNDSGGHPRWWLHAGNHQIVAVSGESFATTSNATRACENFKTHCSEWDYDVYLDSGSQYRWRAKAGNGAIVERRLGDRALAHQTA